MAPTWCASRPPCDSLRRSARTTGTPIKHKLKDYGMMKSFITSGSLTRDKEPVDDPDGCDMMPFPREDAVVMVYNGHPLQGGAACLIWVLGP
jgi:hypothetical protein